MAADTNYGHQSFSVKREVVVKEEGCNSLEELLGGDPTSQQQQVYQDQSPFLYSNSIGNGQFERDKVSAPVNDLPVSDMDLEGFLEMDDKTLSELTGVDSNDWTTLFNGQLDDVNVLEQSSKASPRIGAGVGQSFGMGVLGGLQQPGVDRWLVEETQRLERQQRLQQQKLLELQQTLLKTEILKNQLQIATISQGQGSSPTSMSGTSSMLLGALGNSNSVGLQQQQQQQQQDMMLTANSPVDNSTGTNSNSGGVTFLQSSSMPGSNCSSNPVSPSVSAIEPMLSEISSPAPVLQPAQTKTNRGSVSIATPSPLLAQTSENSLEVKNEILAIPLSPEPSEDEFPKFEPSKRKVHNLIEKKYRCSINDRIGMLRDMVSKHSKDNKKLQKSAVLQKTIDFIRHLQNNIKKLQEENQHLREALARATGSTRLPSYSSPPNTPSGTPSSCESEGDSGHPSPDSNYDGMLSHNSSPSSKNSFFSQFLRNPVQPINGAASQYLMVVMLVAIFFVNPLALSGYGGSSSLHVAPHSTGHARSLNTFEDMGVLRTSSAYSIAYLGLWVLRILVAVVCFGWMTLKTMPRIIANSNESVQFWRFRKQAEKDVEEGDFSTAKDNLEVALCAVNRPIPTSYPALLTGLLWNFLSHLIFELVIGRYAVLLASYFVGAESGKHGSKSGSKSSTIVGVSFRELSETYHLLLQIGLSSPNRSHMRGMNFFLGLNALNLAEADRPFNRLSQSKRAEMYFTMGLCSHYTFPYSSSLPMWYYFFRYRATSCSAQATPLKWAVTPPGKAFLMSSKWEAEVDISPKIYSGSAALPTYAATRSFCKELLCETFHYLLLPDDSPSSQASRDSEVAVQAFKLVLKLAKEAMSSLSSTDSSKNSLTEMASNSDSGFTVIQWWASVGIVSCYWLSGKDSSAEDYYANIEALSGEMGAAVPSGLQLAFKANRLYKCPDSSSSKKVPVQLVLQLCATTSNSLKSSVANLLQDQSNSTDSELHQLGLLQACDWLMNLKVTLWENHGKETRFSEDLCPGFYQDLETLAKLITLLPSAKSRLHLYKGCYQLIACANPLMAHAMLNSTGNISYIRRRGSNKDSDCHNPALCSHEHAMAKVMAYKHLPPSMESPYSLSPPPSPSKRRSPTLQSSPAHA